MYVRVYRCLQDPELPGKSSRKMAILISQPSTFGTTQVLFVLLFATVLAIAVV